MARDPLDGTRILLLQEARARDLPGLLEARGARVGLVTGALLREPLALERRLDAARARLAPIDGTVLRPSLPQGPLPPTARLRHAWRPHLALLRAVHVALPPTAWLLVAPPAGISPLAAACADALRGACHRVGRISGRPIALSTSQDAHELLLRIHDLATARSAPGGAVSSGHGDTGSPRDRDAGAALGTHHAVRRR